MNKFVNNKFEQLNSESFASDKSKEVYSVYSLKGVEQNLIARYFIKPQAKILDIGCGYGRTTVPLVEMGFQVVGIDIVERMIVRARIYRPEIDFRLMSATDLDFPDNSFDYVLFSYNGLDYIYPESRRHLALQEMFRVLRPDGICLLSSHNCLSLFTKINPFYLKIILQNLFRGRIFINYFLVDQPEGKMLTYFKLPRHQKKSFAKVGFEVMECRGKKYSDDCRVNLFESWPYYVLKKK